MLRYLLISNQFVERGLKASGYVALGLRGESNQTIVAIARGKILPEVLQNGRHEINNDSDDDDDANKKVNHLQGKRRPRI